MKKAVSATVRATFTDCSTRMTVVPASPMRRTMGSSCSTTAGRQAQGQLVDHEQLGLGQEGHAQRQHLLLAARKVGRRLLQPAARGPGRSPGPGPALPRRPTGRGGAASRRCGGSRAPTGRRTPRPLRASGRCPTPAISLGGAWVMSRPSKITAPLSASTMPEMALSRVDLPAPLVPSRATIGALGHLEVDAEQHLDVAVEDVEAPGNAAAWTGPARRSRASSARAAAAAHTWAMSAFIGRAGAGR